MHEHAVYGFLLGLIVGCIYVVGISERWRHAYNALLLKYKEEKNQTKL